MLSQEELCLMETKDSVTSISTIDFVPQPLNEKSHFIRNRIFVGNFPDSATQRDINYAFHQFGNIIETNIIESSNCTNRYGFVTFQTIAAADTVLRLHSQGKEFLVKGEPVTINHALFKPKKRCSPKTVLTSTNSQSVMVLGGHTVIAEFVNGMAYFRPIKHDKLTLSSQINTSAIVQKNQGFIMPPAHGLQLANQLRLPTSLPQSVSMMRIPSILPARNICNFTRLPYLPGYNNGLQPFVLPQQARMPPPSPLSYGIFPGSW